MVRARGRGAFYTVGGGGSIPSTGSPTLLTELEIGVGTLLGLGALFLIAEVARPIIEDVEEIESGKRRRGKKGAA